jgi:predicted phosphate transport protein (TIGR00153 family)
MNQAGNILGWLGMTEEHAIIHDAEAHVDETCKTVAYLSEAVRALVAGDLSARTAAIENVKESERRADQLRARMVDQLSEGLLMPPHREDLMRFAKALDKIADLTNSAARLLGFLEEKLPENILRNVVIGTEIIVAGMDELREAIRSMNKNDVKTALAHCKEVEHYEHKADDQKRILLDTILHAKLEPPSLLLCYNLAEVLEGVTDKIETAADWVKVLAVKSR